MKTAVANAIAAWLSVRDPGHVGVEVRGRLRYVDQSRIGAGFGIR